MRNAKYRVLIVGCVSIVFLLGVVLWRYFDPHRTFDVVTVNRDAGVLDRVTTRFERYSFNVGILSPRMNGLNEAIFGHHYGPWPRTLTVEWIVEDHPEDVFKEQLSVPGPLHLHGSEKLQLVIEFKGGAVQAYPRVIDLTHGLQYRFKD